MSKPSIITAIRYFLVTLFFCSTSNTHAELPHLGGAGSNLVSAKQEHTIGQAWLRSLRKQTRLVKDPLINDYLENLTQELAMHADLEQTQFDIVVLKSQSLNAFAVPGGVIGLNAGLFHHTESEQELAAIIAHELAHLSQRHFARNLETAKKNRLPQLAAILGSIIIAAADSKAGMAALATTQAAIKQNQLRYSRENEKEADRIGILTLIKADKDPYAMPGVFEKILKQSRYNDFNIPEFLLTHPLSESRIADSLNRAERYEKKSYTDNLDYYLMTIRTEMLFADNAHAMIKKYQNTLKQNPSGDHLDATRYGLILALTRAGKFSKADKLINSLLDNDPYRNAYIIAKADIDYYSGKTLQAINLLKDHHEINPKNHPIIIRYAEILLKNNDIKTAENVLKKYSRKRSNDPNLWYLLAEVHGLAKNILDVHLARAEYFQLMGDTELAIKQLDYALKLTEGNFAETERIKQRQRDIKKIKALREAMKI